MTTGKRALIVDDSRSARVILSRMLEQHGMAVDTAESAEQALEYLHQHRPDVIFMDHLMPGMDGFQAVQVIKGDPQTAMIPLMMYTSQEGELYVSQARALGAVGVLPKTVRPAEVSRLLYQLHLLPDRRRDRTALFQRAEHASRIEMPVSSAEMPAAQGGAPAESDAGPALVPASAMALSELSTGLRQSLQQLVKDQLAEQRRFMLATFEAFARRLGSEIRETTQKPVAPAVVELPPAEPPRQWWPVVLTMLLGVVPAAVLGFLFWQQLDVNRELGRQVTGLREQVSSLARVSQLAAVPYLQAAPASPSPTDASAAGPAVRAIPATAGAAESPAAAQLPPSVEYVPYGDIPFSGARLAHLQSLAASLESQGFRGRIVAEYSVGDFCLVGSQAQGFEVADPALPLKKCDIVGNPFDDSLSSAQRQSVDFANFAATLGRRTGGAIVIETANVGRRNPVAYPEQSESTSAGAWNTIAAQNNRVDLRMAPAE